jgi:hypothetical protein
LLFEETGQLSLNRQPPEGDLLLLRLRRGMLTPPDASSPRRVNEFPRWRSTRDLCQDEAIRGRLGSIVSWKSTLLCTARRQFDDSRAVNRPICMNASLLPAKHGPACPFSTRSGLSSTEDYVPSCQLLASYHHRFECILGIRGRDEVEKCFPCLK